MGNTIPTLKVGTGWIDLVVTDEPTVYLTFKGYAPVLPVKVKQTGLDYYLYISAVSIGKAIEPLRKDNGGSFKNLEFSIRKADEDKFSPYELKEY